MLNYWWVTRPKRRLDSVPEVLTTFAELCLYNAWAGQKNTHLAYEDALEKAGLKRKGERRDHGGGGARTYAAWLASLGLIFKQQSTGNIMLTLAGEALIDNKPPVEILTNQILKFQYPSAYSVSKGVQINPRFRIRPFRFLLKLMADKRIGYLTEEEIAKVILVEAENESNKCFEYVVSRLIDFRSYGDKILCRDFFELYGPSTGCVNPNHPFSHLIDCANTIINWLEYTQLAHRIDGRLTILDEKKAEVNKILAVVPPFIDRENEHEFYQRKFGLDPYHKKDNRDLAKSKTVTATIILEQKVRSAFLKYASKHPVFYISGDLVDLIANNVGVNTSIVENLLQKECPHGAIGSFMSTYFEMAFKGTEEAIDFEKAITDIFNDVFGFKARHLGQTGSLSAPDVLLLSDSDGYQAIIDNKAYSSYSITRDHHNRMVHNYLENISKYSPFDQPIGFFSYIAGGFIKTFDLQLQKEVSESGIHGSGITVSNFIEMIKKAQLKPYSHNQLREIFGLNRQILLADIN